MKNKTVVVTGAGRGFGMSIVQAFLQSGARVFGLERDETLVIEARNNLAAYGSSFEIVQLDVRDEPSVIDYFNALDGLDILVNNAGIARKQPFLETPTSELEAILEVNLVAAFVVMREAARKMLDHGGQIVNIISDSGLLGIKHMAPYSASKHGLIGLSRSARLELREHNIRVTAFCPGSIATDIFGLGQPNPAAMSPEVLAGLVVYLAGLPPEIEVQEILIEPMSLVEERYLRKPV